jgi:hypothetical protein
MIKLHTYTNVSNLLITNFVQTTLKIKILGHKITKQCKKKINFKCKFTIRLMHIYQERV